ncbi:MAG: nucleotide disphospho-sugar-binding domain-containing protein [Pseudomonadota bacterium]
MNGLLRRGHQVRLLGPATIAGSACEDGAEFIFYSSVPVRDPSLPASEGVSIRVVTDSPGVEEDLGAEISRRRPDVLLSDFFLQSAIRLGRAEGLPTIGLGQTLFRSIAESSLPTALEHADRVLMFSHRRFDSHPARDERYVYVGLGRPFDYPRGVAMWRSRQPRVLVSLSTSFQTQLPLLERICEALSSLPVEAIVTTGHGIAPEVLSVRSNVCVKRFASHDALLPAADLLITHGGHGTVLAGATHGIPALILPMGRDQPTVAAAAVRLGLATIADPNASVPALRTAINAALANAAMRSRVVQFAASIPNDECLETAVDLIEMIDTQRLDPKPARLYSRSKGSSPERVESGSRGERDADRLAEAGP